MFPPSVKLNVLYDTFIDYFINKSTLMKLDKFHVLL